jgi:hypothetical protein
MPRSTLPRSAGRRSGGRPRKWADDRSKASIYWPASHRDVYEQRAAELGLSLNEYVIRTFAELHGLTEATITNGQLPLIGPDEDGELPLGA